VRRHGSPRSGSGAVEFKVDEAIEELREHERRFIPHSNSPGGSSSLGLVRLICFSRFGVSSGIGSINSLPSCFSYPPRIGLFQSEVPCGFYLCDPDNQPMGVREIFQGLESGDGAAFFEHVADKVDWIVEGTHPLAGHYSSKRAVIEGTFAKLAQVLPQGAQLPFWG
jgi:hypothetical protein